LALCGTEMLECVIEQNSGSCGSKKARGVGHDGQGSESSEKLGSLMRSPPRDIM
jgi:hypothetical protein